MTPPFITCTGPVGAESFFSSEFGSKHRVKKNLTLETMEIVIKSKYL